LTKYTSIVVRTTMVSARRMLIGFSISVLNVSCWSKPGEATYKAHHQQILPGAPHHWPYGFQR